MKERRRGRETRANGREEQKRRIREPAKNRAWCLAAVLLMCLLLPVMVSVTVLADTGREGRKTGKGTAPPEETVRSREEAPETDGSSQRKKPEVAAAIDGSLHREAEEGYYNAPRKATVTITDTEELFDEEAATAAIHISRDGKALEPGELVSKWSHDGDSHSAVIAFREDGRYTWKLSPYTNRAGLVSEGVHEQGDALYSFTIDTQKPLTSDTGSREVSWIGYGEKIWSKLHTHLSFGTWERQGITVHAEGKDALSPVYAVKYYKADGRIPMDTDALEEIYESRAFTEIPYTVEADEKFVVYARITDYAGNTVYISTDGLTVDRTPGSVKLRTLNRPHETGWYFEPVAIEVRADDLQGNAAAYAGLRTVDYTITNPETGALEEGNLYTFSESSPGRGEPPGEWQSRPEQKESYITVDAQKFEAAGVKVTVTAEDLAGNIIRESLSLNICGTPPAVSVEFQDTAVRIEAGRGYFSGARSAVVTVTDRPELFGEEALEAGMTVSAEDAEGRPVSLKKKDMIGEWKHSGNVHTVRISFAEDGNYTWKLSYTNRAGISCMWEQVRAKGDSPWTFTVDGTIPSGSLTVEERTFHKLLTVLTFGLYRSRSVKVTAVAQDATSPVVMEYYKTDHAPALTQEQLRKLWHEDERNRKKPGYVPYFQKYTGAFTVPDKERDERFVIYLRISDYAGNDTYVSSEGYLVDRTPCDITLTPEKTNENGIYQKDVKVAVRVREPEPYAGIRRITYEVKNRGQVTQQGVLFSRDYEEAEEPEAPLGLWESRPGVEESYITVEASRNNSCDVTVSVCAVDRVGNRSEASVRLDIDCSPPVITVQYDQNRDHQGSGYFAEPRTATVRITERRHHFNAEAATEGILIQGVDVRGQEVELDRGKMIGKWTTETKDSEEECVHTVKLLFDVDANYRVSISCTDLAGNRNRSVDTGTSVHPWKFTVDQTPPDGSVKARTAEGNTRVWKRLAKSMRVSLCSAGKIIVTGTAEDVTSPVEEVVYCRVTDSSELTEQALKSRQEDEWKPFRRVILDADQQTAVCVRITDLAGNVSWISSGGLVVDTAKPVIAAMISGNAGSQDRSVNAIDHGDVKIRIHVREPERAGVRSGLKSVSVEVLDLSRAPEEQVTQQKLLFSSEKTGLRRRKKQWAGAFTVDSRKNNSNQIMLRIRAEDHAGNVSQTRRMLKIDTTKPQIQIRYDNNSPDGGRYYQTGRTATVIVTERNFDPKDVEAVIQNTAGSVPVITGWTTREGTGNRDDTRHMATIAYQEDGDYTFSIGCRDQAGNRCQAVVYENGTTDPEAFTIDRTAPVVTVSYDNNDVRNGHYFQKGRTATVTITEHNFDRDRVRFTGTATLEGHPVPAPDIFWKDSGDEHTAVIPYEADADYTFGIELKDLAGNENGEIAYGETVAGNAFTVDTFIEKPQIRGVENGKSYRGEVLPLISCRDVNFASDEIRLFRTGRDGEKKEITKEFLKGLKEKGGSGCGGVFERKREHDGIYTLIVKASDLAGNEEKEKITFTVNRFGSVYVFDKYLLSLKEAYTQNVEKGLVITEYNPDRLKGGSVKVLLSRDGTLMEHVDYTVTPVENHRVKDGENGWYEYHYEISPDNFQKDGVYRLSVVSGDQAGNRSDTAGSREGEILFRVDTAPPEITDVTGLEQAIVDGESLQVGVGAFDSIGLKKLTVYLDGQEAGIYEPSKEGIHLQGSFEIPRGMDHRLRFLAEDLAGNLTDTDARDESGQYLFRPAFGFHRRITVSPDGFVRWYADRRSFRGTVAGVTAGIFLLYFLQRKYKGRKCRKRREHRQRKRL